MLFTELPLPAALLRAIKQCGYQDATPIQAAAIPQAVAGHDLIASAQTGTGKTAAFVLPALVRLQSRSVPPGIGPRVLVLTPTRELAMQVTDSVASYGRGTRMRFGAVLGGMPYPQQVRMLRQPIDLLVATPGRLIDHIENGKVDLGRVELLVLDEADRMLDMGFSDAVDLIAGKTPQSRQTLLFTATMDAPMARLAGRLLKDPQRIDVIPAGGTHACIEQQLFQVDDFQHKQALLVGLLENLPVSSAIVFCATKVGADDVAAMLKSEGFAAAPIHGDLGQGARMRTLRDFKSGRVRILVATDVAARGLDINGVSHVINYDLPRATEDYVHRIGRTGRAGEQGIAISLALPNEGGLVRRIEGYQKQTIERHQLEGFEPKRGFEQSQRPSGRRQGPRRSSHGGGARPPQGSGGARPAQGSGGARPAQGSGGARPSQSPGGARPPQGPRPPRKSGPGGPPRRPRG